MRDHRSVSRVVAVLIVGVLAAGRAAAGERPEFQSGDHCSYGDATMSGEAFYPLGSAPGAPSTRWLCQFREHFIPYTEYCFCEQDSVSGATTWSTERSLGALQFLSGVQAEYILIPEGVIDARPVTTPAAGLRLEFSDEGEGVHIIRKQFGMVFTDLVPGIYDLTVLLTHSDYPSFFESYHSFFRALPHEVAHEHGLPPAWGTAVCPLEDQCDDTLDNDGDGQADCADYNCQVNVWGQYDGTDGPCFAGSYVELGDEIATPLWEGSTIGAPDDWAFPDTLCDWPGTGHGGADRAAHWTVPETGTYTFGLTTEFWGYLGVYTGTKSWCSQDTNEVPVAPVPLEAGQTITIVVDGVNDWDEGLFEVSVERTD